MSIGTDVLVYDIETRTFGKPDPQKDRLRIFGCYSYKTNKTYLLTDTTQIQKIIDAHKFLVGFNNEKYDNVVLEREGFKLKYKITIDLMKILYQRAGGMKIKKGMLGNLLMKYSLDYVTKTLGLVNDDDGKMQIDYSLFQKETWTKAESDYVAEYTKKDIEVTKKLYEWIEDYFDGFKDFLKEADVARKTYLTASIAKFSYKAICNAMLWDEQYAQDGFGGDGGGIAGGYVAYPAGEEFEGDIYCLDYNSLYPHIMIQCNLYGRVQNINDSESPTYSGGDKWKLEGMYRTDELSGVGLLLKTWYYARLYYKRNFVLVSDGSVHKMKDIKDFVGQEIWHVAYYDARKGSKQELVKITVTDRTIEKYLKLVEQGVDRREYTVKIIINTIYGILNTPYYLRVFDTIAGGDCTRAGRQWTKHARRLFREAGYPVLYTDTDSVYIKDPFNDKAKMLKVRDQVVADIKGSTPFPQDTFDMGIDDEIKYMFFFKGKDNNDKTTDDEMDADDFVNKPKGLLKKNYIYVTKDDRVVIKNLGLKKKSNSELSKKIFWEHMVPQIKKGNVKFSKTWVKNLIMKLLESDFMLASLRKEVGPIAQYKNNSSLAAQITLKYGPGIHFLIPNTSNVGVGKGKKFCTVEEFKMHNLGFENINLDGVWAELNYFIKPVVVKDIFSFGA